MLEGWKEEEHRHGLEIRPGEKLWKSGYAFGGALPMFFTRELLGKSYCL